MNRYILILLALWLPFAALSKRRSKEVVQDYTPILTEAEQQHFDSLYIHALTQKRCDRPDSAVAVIRQAIHFYNDKIEGRRVNSRQVPGLAAAYYFLSNYYRQRGESAKALGHMEAAVAIDSTNYWYTQGQTELLLELRQLDRALVSSERLVRLHPKKSDPLFAMAEIYLRVDSIDLCLETLDKLEELEGINPQITLRRFYILHEKGRDDEAFATYRRLIERYPYEVQYRLQYGDLQMQFGQIQQAKATYDGAAALEPDNAYVWLALSNYYAITGDLDESDKLVNAALLNPNIDVETQVKMLTEYLKQTFRRVKRDSIAADERVDSLFRNISAMHPTEPEFYNLHADWLTALGRDSLAAEQERFAVDLRPANKEYWERYIYYCAQSTDIEKPVTVEAALAHCEEALAVHPDLQTAHSVKAWIFGRQKNYAAARDEYRTMLAQTDASKADAISNLWTSVAETFMQEERMDSAYVCFDMALKYNPNNYAVLNNYAYYLSLEGRDLVRAESMAQKVIQQYPDNATYLDTYAWILYLQGSYMLAHFYQQKAIDNIGNDDHDGTIYHHYGDILVKEGDLKGAVEQWRKALEAPNCSDADDIQKKIESAELLLKK